MTTIDLMVVLGFCLGIAIYGIWRYSAAETNSYNRFIDKANSLEGRMTKMELVCLQENSRSFLDSISRVAKLEEKVTLLQIETDQLQDHCARLRKSQIDLRDRSYPRTIEVTFPDKVTGAIPVEIRGPTKQAAPKPKTPTPPQAKKLLKKTAKQIRSLSK